MIGIEGIPMIKEGDDLTSIILDASQECGVELLEGDILCIAQKIISKSEGMLKDLASIAPSSEAIELAGSTKKDPRMVQLILDESTEILRSKENVIIARHKLGIVGAHAGIDQSNIDHVDGEKALLLPKDPDLSAKRIRAELRRKSGVADIGVIVTDSHNRPWRMGTIGVAIGSSGVKVLDDRVGGTDIFNRKLNATLINNADAVANAATLVMGETTEQIPVAIVRGLDPEKMLTNDPEENGTLINRPLDQDMFR